MVNRTANDSGHPDSSENSTSFRVAAETFPLDVLRQAFRAEPVRWTGRLSLLLPNRDHSGNLVVHHELWVSTAQELLAQYTQGCRATVMPSLWNGRSEDTTVIVANVTTEFFKSCLEGLANFLRLFKAVTKQEVVHVEYEADGHIWTFPL